jgi:prolyl 4-hydroxylase
MSLSRLPADWAAWVRDNVSRGCHVDTMLPLLVGGGFDAALAAAAISEAQGRPVPGRVRPQIDLAVNSIDCGGHSVRIVGHLDQPQIVLLDHLLSDAECDALGTLAEGQMAPSTVIDDVGGQPRPDDRRSSAGTFFARAQTPLIAALEQRIANLVDWPAEHGEGLQVLRYAVGGEYRAHFDYFDPAKPGSLTHLQRGGQRVATLVIYLAEPEAGGATRFPDIGFEARPHKGSAVYFANVGGAGQIDPASLHAGMPVLQGVKLIATKWLRERPY